MATATMGLRRRVHQVSTTSSTPSTSSTSTSSGASTSNSSSHSSGGGGGGGGKRTRSDNNNSPSQGNLNSPEPAPKKARNSSRVAAAKAKELEMAKKVTPPHWSDTRQFASIAGLSLQDQAALCSNALPSPVSYLSSQMATFVGNAAASLGKGPGAAVSYLDISNMTAGAGPRPNWPNQDASTADPISLAFSAAAAFPSTSKSNSSSSSTPAVTSTATSETATSPQQQQPPAITLPKNFPNDAMFNTYQPWVIKTYGDLAKTKTITIKKYARILRTLRGEEVNSAENSKFRFWVKSKGFHIGQPEGYEAKPADRIIGRHAVTTPGLDPPLYVPTQPPHNKALNGAEGTVPPGRVYKKVAIVENFFDIIHAVHVDLEGRPGKHAGQKRTYRTITETYAFLPREAVTRFLLGCTECQRRPRTPSPTTTTAGTITTKLGSPSPTASPSPTPEEKKDEPTSPKAAAAAVTNDAATDAAASAAEATCSEKPVETSAVCAESKNATAAVAAAVAENEDKPEVVVSKSTETMTPATTSTTSIATTTMPSSDANKSDEASNSSSSSNNNNNNKNNNHNSSSNNNSSSEIKASSEISTTTTTTTTSLGNNNSNAPNEAAKFKARDEKYNPLSITNLLRKDPVKRRSPPIITTAYQPFPTSDAYAYTMTATTAMSTDNRGNPSSTYIRKLHGEDRAAACASVATAAVAAAAAAAAATVTRPWSPGRVESKYSPLDYSRSLIPEQAQTKPATNPHSEPVKKAIQRPQSLTTTTTAAAISTSASVAAAAPVASLEKAGLKSEMCEGDGSQMEENAFSPTAGLIDTNLNLLATIQQLHCQVMLALTERLRPAVATSPAAGDS